MTSQGQRFRRKALRRGYKVDEVDAFLDRVEATLADELLEAPVTAQEVHDVVFRVRFGGYDEWQVDLHLDRVERQLAEAPPAPAFARPPDQFGGVPERDQFGVPERMELPDRMGPPAGVPGPGPGPGSGFGPGPQPGPVPHQGPPPGMGGPPPGMGVAPAPVAGQNPPLPMRQPLARAGGPGGYQDPPEPAYGPYDEPTYGGYDGHLPPRRGGDRPDQLSDMTSEMRFGDPGGRPGPPEAGMPGAGSGPAGQLGPASYPPAGPAGSPPPPPMSGYAGAGPAGGGYSGGGPGDLQRLDELRRTFQPRRFGSGYDRTQVDRLFEEAMAGISGHGPMSVTESELDPRRFDLVPGGYFEAEVEQALHELRDILRRA